MSMTRTKIAVGRSVYSDGGVLRIGRYRYGGGIALMVESESGEPQYTATVNVPHEPPAEGCVWLKGWSENEGVPAALESAGIGTLTGRRLALGHVEAEEMRLSLAIEALAPEPHSGLGGAADGNGEAS